MFNIGLIVEFEVMSRVWNFRMWLSKCLGNMDLSIVGVIFSVVVLLIF